VIILRVSEILVGSVLCVMCRSGYSPIPKRDC